MDAKAEAKLARLIEAGRELTTKMQAVLDEVDALIGGKAGIGQQLADFEAWFDQVWGLSYAAGETGKYIWSYQKDRPQTKRLIKQLGLDELKRRVKPYLDDREPFLVRNRHSFGLFVRNVNHYASVLPPFEDDEDIRATQQRIKETRGTT